MGLGPTASALQSAIAWSPSSGSRRNLSDSAPARRMCGSFLTALTLTLALALTLSLTLTSA